MSSAPPAGTTTLESRPLYALAGGLLLGGPVWWYLFDNHYPFSRPEAILLPLLAAGVGAVIALVARRRGGVIGSLICGVLLYLFVDLQFDLDKTIPTLPVIAGSLVLPFLFRARRAALACITLTGLYLASLIRPGLPQARAGTVATGSAQRDLPLVLHIVLDEAWGIGGFRAAGDTATAEFLTRFYLQRGFELYEAAYSRWGNTKESIPALVSLQRPVALTDQKGRGLTLRSNPYFERLRQLGYKIHVYQSSYIDYCHAARVVVASCQEAPANSIVNVSYLAAPWTTRTMIAGRYLLSVASHAYDRLIPDVPAVRRAYPSRGLAEIWDVSNRISARPGGGNVIFVHVLLPHRPLSLNADCSVYRDLTKGWSYGEPWPSTPAEQRSRLMLYGAQVRCAHRAIGKLFTMLDRTVGRDGAVVIVHGDHGSRWMDDNPGDGGLAWMRGPYLNSAFSTILAIRRPHVPAALHTEAVPIQDFFWDLIEREFVGTSEQHWAHDVRHQQPVKAHSTDTLRRLSQHEMPWVRQSP